MSPRGRKVGGIDDPIWGGEAPAEESGDQASGASGASGAGTPATSGAGTRGASGRPPRPGPGQGNTKVGATQGSRSTRATPAKSDRPASRGRQDRYGSGDGGGPSGIVQNIPRRILVDDPATARSDERECEVEGWFQTDDGVPVSSAFRPLSVACARSWGHSGRHRSKPRRALFHSGRVWVYEWRNAEEGQEN